MAEKLAVPTALSKIMSYLELKTRRGGYSWRIVIYRAGSKPVCLL
jgi:hypothetical protein